MRKGSTRQWFTVLLIHRTRSIYCGLFIWWPSLMQFSRLSARSSSFSPCSVCRFLRCSFFLFFSFCSSCPPLLCQPSPCCHEDSVLHQRKYLWARSSFPLSSSSSLPFSIHHVSVFVDSALGYPAEKEQHNKIVEWCSCSLLQCVSPASLPLALSSPCFHLSFTLLWSLSLSLAAPSVPMSPPPLLRSDWFTGPFQYKRCLCCSVVVRVVCPTRYTTLTLRSWSCIRLSRHCLCPLCCFTDSSLCAHSPIYFGQDVSSALRGAAL